MPEPALLVPCSCVWERGCKKSYYLKGRKLLKCLWKCPVSPPPGRHFSCVEHSPRCLQNASVPDSTSQAGFGAGKHFFCFSCFNFFKLWIFLCFGNLLPIFFLKQNNEVKWWTCKNFTVFCFTYVSFVAKSSCAVLYLHACPPHQWLYRPPPSPLLDSCAHLPPICALTKATWP